MNRVASCPYCGAAPRYGLLEHIQWCSKRPSEASLAPHDAEVADALTEVVEAVRTSEGYLVALECPKCGKGLKKRGAHFHIRSCKGAD